MANKRTPVKAPAVSTPPTTAPETKKMTDQILSDMLKFIQEGKKDAVREAMGKYTMTLAQKKVLEVALAK
jgi:tartrate dehydratase beta subunit/fumarate hydratase class I family protein